MPKKEYILSDERLTDGSDTVLKATLYQTRTLRNGKTIYVYTRNLHDINTPFGEIDESVTAATTAACGGNVKCQEQVIKVKRASKKKKILEEGPVGQQLTMEELADLDAGMLAIEAEDEQLNDLLGALSFGGKRRRRSTNRYKNKKRKTNKRYKNKRRRTNKRR
jgi:hypothetical protein